jgi:hypothetical protein
MRVVVPYTRRQQMQPWQRGRYGDYAIEYVALTQRDTYRQLLQRLWVERTDVIIIEPDLVPWPGAIEDLCACPQLWCSYTLSHAARPSPHLFGATKLTADLMARTADVWDTAISCTVQFDCGWLLVQHTPLHLHGEA